MRPRPARLSRADLGLRREWFLLDGGPGVGDPARTRNGCSTAKLRFLRCLRRPTVVALPWTSGPSRSRSDALHPEIQFSSIRRPSGTPGTHSSSRLRNSVSTSKMFSFNKLSLALLPFVSLALAQSAVWGQCGGIGWTGATTCGASILLYMGIRLVLTASIQFLVLPASSSTLTTPNASQARQHPLQPSRHPPRPHPAAPPPVARAG